MIFFNLDSFQTKNLNTFRTNIKNISDFFHNLQVPAEIMIQSVLAFLVIYHEIRDFELDPRDKNFCSVTSHEPLKVRDFGKFPKKLGKSSNFAQKVIISVTKNQKKIQTKTFSVIFPRF